MQLGNEHSGIAERNPFPQALKGVDHDQWAYMLLFFGLMVVSIQPSATTETIVGQNGEAIMTYMAKK